MTNAELRARELVAESIARGLPCDPEELVKVFARAINAAIRDEKNDMYCAEEWHNGETCWAATERHEPPGI